MEWNTAEVGLGEQQGRNCGSQVNCSDTNWLFWSFPARPCITVNCVRLGLLSVVNALYRIKGQQNTMTEVFFTSSSSRASAFYSLCTNTCNAMGHYDYKYLPRPSPHLGFCLGRRNSKMRSMSKDGKMSQNSHHHDEELKGLIYEDGLKQLNRVAKSWPNSMGLSYALKLEGTFVSRISQGHNRSWKGEKMFTWLVCCIQG